FARASRRRGQASAHRGAGRRRAVLPPLRARRQALRALAARAVAGGVRGSLDAADDLGSAAREAGGQDRRGLRAGVERAREDPLLMATPAIRIDAARFWTTVMRSGEIGPGKAGGLRRLALTDADKEMRDLFVTWCTE